MHYLDEFLNWIKNNQVISYLWGGMLVAWTFQRVKQLNNKEKLSAALSMSNSFFCSLSVCVISLPLYKTFPNWPLEYILIIGAVCGTLGYEGISKLVPVFGNLLLTLLQNKLKTEIDNNDLFHVDTSKTSHTYVLQQQKKSKTKAREPPMPVDRRPE